MSLDAVPADRPLSVDQLLFGETPWRLLVSVAPRRERRFRRMMRGLPAARIGAVAADDLVRVTREGAEVGSLPIGGIRAAWRSDGAASEDEPATEDAPREPRP